MTLWSPDPLTARPPPDPTQASWLLESGLMTERIAAASGSPAELTVLDEYPGTLDGEQRRLLEANRPECRVRAVLLLARRQPWIYAETLIPDATLAAHPWLATLGTTALGMTLARRADVSRGPLEFTRLEPDAPMARRAQASAGVPRAALWARRAVHSLGPRRLLVHEVLLPVIGAAEH